MKWSQDDSGTQQLQPTYEEREHMAQAEEWNSFPDVPWNLACHKKVWDSANFRQDSYRDLMEITTRDRAESCFYYRFTPGMVFKTGEDIQRSEKHYQAAREKRKGVTRKTLIALAALMLAILSLVAYIIWH